MKRLCPPFPKRLRSIVLFIALTLLTQVGGIIWFSIRNIGKRFSEKRKIQLAINLGIYAMITLTIVPVLARIGGRVALPIIATEKAPVAPRSFLFVLMNRHYSKPDARNVLLDAARKLRKAHPKSVVHYLDAGFPFWDKFVLLPHLSHNKGEAIDLAFCYHKRGKPSKYKASPSPVGYLIYECPDHNEYQPYESKSSYLRWDMPFIQWARRGRELDRDRTRYLMKALLQDSRTNKVLLEAHLHRRWGIVHQKLRFQQLQAARHDDHLHVWVKEK